MLRASCLFSLFASLLATPPSMAELPTSFIVEVQPVYELVLFPETPLNPVDENAVVPFAPLGEMGFEFANNDLNDPLATSAEFATLSGEFSGDLGGTPYDLRIIQFLGGGLSNIARDTNDDFVAADVTFTAIFEQILGPGTTEAVRVFGGEMTFTGVVDAVPFDIGTSFASPEFVDLFLDTGNDTSLLVGGVQDRFLNVVPEPSAIWLAGLCAVGIVAARRRHSLLPVDPNQECQEIER